MYIVIYFFCKYVALYILALIQPPYALLPATSYPKTIGGMCYAIIELTSIGLNQPLVISQSQARELDMLSQHASIDKLSQHAVAPIIGQENQICYPSMQSRPVTSQESQT